MTKEILKTTEDMYENSEKCSETIGPIDNLFRDFRGIQRHRLLLIDLLYAK